MAETKYGKHVIRDAYKKHHQLECVSVHGDEIDADCIITHQVIYKPETMLKETHFHDDFQQVLCFLGTNPMDCRDFGGAEVEISLGEEHEKHLINSPTVVSLTKGLPHGPLEFKNIPKPIIFLEVMLTRKYHVKKLDEDKEQ